MGGRSTHCFLSAHVGVGRSSDVLALFRRARRSRELAAIAAGLGGTRQAYLLRLSGASAAVDLVIRLSAASGKDNALGVLYHLRLVRDFRIYRSADPVFGGRGSIQEPGIGGARKAQSPRRTSRFD